MKKLAMLLLLLQVLGSSLQARCINAKHLKAKTIVIDGTKEQSVVYACPVYAQEEEHFDKKGFCKYCGCAAKDHDNPTAGPQR